VPLFLTGTILISAIVVVVEMLNIFAVLQNALLNCFRKISEQKFIFVIVVLTLSYEILV
jgi:hypothetical protein